MKRLSLTLSLALLFSLGAFASAPRYIFYFIGDGMGLGAVALADSYARAISGDSSHLTMMRMPVVSLATTYSASSPVTDSAAAGTALACGVKTKNGMLGMTADSVVQTSIAERLHQLGYGVGLVTSVAPDDATPASFYAHQPHRSMFYEIGCDAAKSGFEFLAGASLRGLKDSDGNPTDLIRRMESNGIDIVRGLDSLRFCDSRRIVLLSDGPGADNSIGYVVDSLPDAMTLSAMTQACLDHLEKVSPDGFFMMVEGGAIDHNAHANDAAATVMETLAFNEALDVAMRFYGDHPDETLIVVTADHETGGLVLANRTLHYYIEPSKLRYAGMSKAAFSDYCKSIWRSKMVITWEDMKQTLSDRLGLYVGIPVSEKEDEKLRGMFDELVENRASADEKTLYKNFSAFSVAVFDLINSVSGVGWTTGDHSGTPVPVFAVGVGASRFSPMQDNTELPRKILSIVGDAE